MKFTDWQIDRLRNGLHSYRTANKVNGQEPSWKTVAHSLLMCPATVHNYPADGREPALKGEAVRRFADGLVVPDQVKLEDIARFLIHVKELTAVELKEGEPGTQALLTAVLALGQKQETSRASVAALAGEYVASRHAMRADEYFRLRIFPDAELPLCRIEEYMRAEYREKSGRRRDDEAFMDTVNHGYGCAFTSGNRLMIYIISDDGSGCAAIIEDSIREGGGRPQKLAMRRIDAAEPVDEAGNLMIYTAVPEGVPTP